MRSQAEPGNECFVGGVRRDVSKNIMNIRVLLPIGLARRMTDLKHIKSGNVGREVTISISRYDSEAAKEVGYLEQNRAVLRFPNWLPTNASTLCQAILE